MEVPSASGAWGQLAGSVWRTSIQILNSANKPTAEEQHDVDHLGILSIIVFLGAKHRMCTVVLGTLLHAAENYRELWSWESPGINGAPTDLAQTSLPLDVQPYLCHSCIAQIVCGVHLHCITHLYVIVYIRPRISQSVSQMYMYISLDSFRDLHNI